MDSMPLIFILLLKYQGLYLKLSYMDIYIGNINDYSTEYLSGLVSEDRVKAAMKYRFESDRKRTLLAHALLNHAVSKKFPDMPLPVNPVTDGYGKPHIHIGPDDEIFFSLSHSGDHSICAVAPKPVGADIEEIKDDKEKIADRFFAAKERGYVRDAKSFYRIWSLKESFMKAVGLGMKLPMDSFTVSDFNEKTGICTFRSSDNGDDDTKDINSEIEKATGMSLFDPATGYYKISGMALTIVPGYSLAFSICCFTPDKIDVPKISYPVL